MELPKGLQCSLTNVINMGHIQTYASALSTEELTMHPKQDREKSRAMFHNCIKLFTQTPSYVCPYYISGRKWSTTHIAQIAQEHDRHNIYPIMKTMWPPCYHISGFIATHALGTWWTKLQQYIMRRGLDLPYSHSGSRYCTSSPEQLQTLHFPLIAKRRAEDEDSSQLHSLWICSYTKCFL